MPDRTFIMHAVNRWLPLTANWIYTQIRNLPGEFENHVVTCLPLENLDRFYLPNIHSISDSPWGKVFRVSEKLRHCDFLPIRVPAKGISHALRNRYLLSHIRQCEAQVLHSHIGPQGWQNIGVVQATGLKHIVTFYGQEITRYPQSDPRWYKRYHDLFANVDRVLCEGPYMAQSIVELGCPREKKGIPYALEALGKLQQQVSLEITIIGDSTGRPSSESEKEKMLTVAHFRGVLFQLSETFLYNYLTAFQRTRPIGITCRRVNADLFPFSYPLVEILSRNLWSRGSRWIKQHIFSQQIPRDYDVSKTYEALEKYDVQVLHAHLGFTGVRILPVKHKADLPLITTFYGVDISAKARVPEWRRKYLQLFNEGELFLVEGPFMQEQLLNLGCPPEKSAIQRIAIFVDQYPFRGRLPKSKDQTIKILFCGRFTEKKGLIYALKAVRRAREQHSNLQFRIIGDGELHSEIEAFIGKHRMQSYTKVLGYQPHHVFIEELQNTDIFIQPSVLAEDGDSEGGAPTTLLEAQACGVPVLASTHADIPNVVVPGKSALLAPERDVDTLTDHLLALIREPERWADMGHVGRSFVKKYHDVISEVKLLEDRYYELAMN
jgi:colanic acid/amylovoran biosynthesis glycosyltransferase